ncbi:MAG: hypothetical protein VX460_07675 [Planctomycetota bacterium]|nr:hypothetical protein [Planctomycetota bacterium]
MHRAWVASREPGFADEEGSLDRALADALTAAELDPTWAAPRRFVDDWTHRRGLTLPAPYGEHLRAARTGSAVDAYLAARLSGDGADVLLDQARRLDPLLGWAWHGEAWRAFAAGRIHRATVAGSRAVRYASDPLELAHFSCALSRYLRADERAEAARSVLEAALLGTEQLVLRPAERAMVGAELALAELESIEERARRRGAARALELVADPRLTGAERAALAVTLSGLGDDQVPGEALALALFEAADESLLERSGKLSRRGRLLQGFGAGLDGARIARAFERWRGTLPAWVLDEQGTPRRPALAGVARAVEAHAEARVLDSGLELCAALIEAGWFAEARALTGALAPEARDEKTAARVRELRGRALRGVALMAEVAALARRVDAREAYRRAGATGADGVTPDEAGLVDSLGELTAELARMVGSDALAETSPRIRYGPLGEVLHPGPVLSAEDEELGRGTQGDVVGGVAGLFLELGRFALVGQGVGQGGPDATVLRLVHVEERSGDHRGRPFRGTVFWCDGADVPGRFGRLGAAISGAALHEGYYVDLSMVAVDLARWDAVRERFAGDDAAISRARAAAPAAAAGGLRAMASPPLGAADRMRLSVMSERARAAGASLGELEPMTLSELAAVVAVHEEGHLCDRGSWYPLGPMQVVRLLSFGAAHGFNGKEIARALEARAQLVALCEAEDVRLAWVDILDAAEGGGAGVTPHGRAYSGLLQDLIDRLEAEFRAGGWQGAGLDPAGRWVDQLHRLDGEALRGLALREARSRGLTRP